MTPTNEQRFVERHIKALRRRHDYLQGVKRNSYDNAELSALNWALHTLSTSDQPAQKEAESVHVIDAANYPEPQSGFMKL